MTTLPRIADSRNRGTFIGGSDARIIMGNDEAALIRLWREKRGEVGPEDSPAISSYSSETSPRSSTEAGMSATPVGPSGMSNAW